MAPDLSGDMPPVAALSTGGTAARAGVLFEAHRLANYRRTDRMFAYLMGAQWIAGIIFALVVAPQTWAGAESQVHVHVWAAVIFGGIISAMALITIAPALARIGLEFGPWDYFSLIIFALTITASLAGEHMVKGLIAGVVGLLVATVGEEEVNGVSRMVRTPFFLDTVVLYAPGRWSP